MVSRLYCRHRWTNIKQWIANETLYVIQRCRWCNRWQRVETPQYSIDGNMVNQIKSYVTKVEGKADEERAGTRQLNVDSTIPPAQIVESEHLNDPNM